MGSRKDIEAWDISYFRILRYVAKGGKVVIHRPNPKSARDLRKSFYDFRHALAERPEIDPDLALDAKPMKFYVKPQDDGTANVVILPEDPNVQSLRELSDRIDAEQENTNTQTQETHNDDNSSTDPDDAEQPDLAAGSH